MTLMILGDSHNSLMTLITREYPGGSHHSPDAFHDSLDSTGDSHYSPDDSHYSPGGYNDSHYSLGDSHDSQDY